MKRIMLGAALILAAAGGSILAGFGNVGYCVFANASQTDYQPPRNLDDGVLPAGFEPLYKPALREESASSRVDGNFTQVIWAGSEPVSTYPTVTAFVNVTSAAALYCGYMDFPDPKTLFDIYEGNAQRTILSVDCVEGGDADIVVVFDDTGSMGGIISGMKASVREFTDNLINSKSEYGSDPAFGLVSFKDDYQVRQPLTTNVEEFYTAVDGLVASGGGDGPEFSFDAVAAAVEQMSWRPGSTHVVILFTDAQSHYRGDGSTATQTVNTTVDLLTSNATTVYTVAPARGDYTANNDPRLLASRTGGIWIDSDSSDIASALGLISAQLTSHYIITYLTDDLNGASLAFRVDDDSTAGEAADGSTWSRAFPTIQPAIDAAFDYRIHGQVSRLMEVRTHDPDEGEDVARSSYTVSLGDPLNSSNVEVWVAGGTYDETREDRVTALGSAFRTYDTGALVLKPGVNLMGGFIGTDAQDDFRDIATYPSIIDGSVSREVKLNDDETVFKPAYHVLRAAPYNGKAIEASIDGVTILGGYGGTRSDAAGTDAADYGGGVLLDGLTVTINDCIITGNHSYFGGGIGLRDATLNVSGSTITGNDAYAGGGLYAIGATSNITASHVTSNTALTGGGAEFVASFVSVTGGDFSQNTAEVSGAGAVLFSCVGSFSTTGFSDNTGAMDGGALFVQKSKLTIAGGDYKTNSAVEDGGAIYLTESVPHISGANGEEATFTNNYAGRSSGAIALSDCRVFDPSVPPSITGCKFLDNRAGIAAGALGVNIGTVNVSRSTFLRNSAGEYGGAIYFGGEYSAGNFTNLVVAQNSITKGLGNGIYVDGNYSSTTIQITNCTVVDNTSGDGLGSGLLYAGNLTIDVLNCIFWGNQGGGVSAYNEAYLPSVRYSIVQKTTPVLGVNNLNIDPKLSTAQSTLYWPLAGSPAVNSGLSNGAPTVDRNGTLRPQGNGIDRGAYEQTASSIPQASMPAVPVAVVEPAFIDFGEIALDEVVQADFEVSNAGDGELIGEAGVLAPFEVVAGGGYTLAPSEKQTVTVQFSPKEVGTYSTNISVSGALVALSAKVTAPPPPPSDEPNPHDPGPVAAFSDPNLEQAVRLAVGKPTGTLYVSDIAALTVLDASACRIASLEGIQQCAGLTQVYLPQNRIADLTPLAALASLAKLNIAYNRVADLSPLRPLAKLANLNLSVNSVTDLVPLLDMAGMKAGAQVLAKGNSLCDDTLCQVIPALQAKGVYVEHDGTCPDTGDDSGTVDPPVDPPVDDGTTDGGNTDPKDPSPVGCAGVAGGLYAVSGDVALFGGFLLALGAAGRKRRQA